MKGQLVFEFIVAGLIFFTIIVYTINYLNVNVSDFKSKSYYNRLQNKAIQVSEVLVGGPSPLSIADDSEFNFSRIQEFNDTYCNLTDTSKYQNLIKDLHLYEKTVYGTFSNDIKIRLSKPGGMLLDCGPGIPENTTKVEAGRVGILNKEIVELMVVVW